MKGLKSEMNQKDKKHKDERMVFFKPEAGLKTVPESNLHYHFSDDAQNMIIRQTWSGQRALRALALHFTLDHPERFDIHLWVPEQCANACLTLNGQSLVGWFAAEPVIELPGLEKSPCAESAASNEKHSSRHFSTIRPGTWQLVNFRWQTEDHLVLHLYNPDQ